MGNINKGDRMNKEEKQLKEEKLKKEDKEELQIWLDLITLSVKVLNKEDIIEHRKEILVLLKEFKEGIK